MGSISALLTAFYSIRLIYLTFLTNPNSKKEILIYTHESSLNILFPLFFLALGSIFVGYLTKEITLSNIIHPVVPNHIKILPIILSLSGGFCALLLYNRLWGYYVLMGAQGETPYNKNIYHSIYTFLNSA